MGKIKLEFIIFCEKASIDEVDKKLSILKIFDGVNTHGFPAVGPNIMVVAKFIGDTGKHSEILKIKKEGAEIGETGKVEFEIGVGRKHQIVHDVSGILFPEAGEYTFEVFIDEEKIGASILNVNKV